MQNYTKIIFYFSTFSFIVFLCSCAASINLTNRVGFGLAEKAEVEFWSSKLGAEWYFDWGTREIPSSNKLEYWQTIRVYENGFSPSKDKIEQLLKKYPGHTWIIGNEPDNRYQEDCQDRGREPHPHTFVPVHMRHLGRRHRIVGGWPGRVFVMKALDFVFFRGRAVVLVAHWVTPLESIVR